jgi:putative molybdopterin biosynthesis protein
VAAAVAQGRADWGMAIETVARDYGLGFLPLQEEHYDFVVPASRMEREPVRHFRRLLAEPAVRDRLRDLGFRPAEAGPAATVTADPG